jgi:hypothetical protein
VITNRIVLLRDRILEAYQRRTKVERTPEVGVGAPLR